VFIFYNLDVFNTKEEKEQVLQKAFAPKKKILHPKKGSLTRGQGLVGKTNEENRSLKF